MSSTTESVRMLFDKMEEFLTTKTVVGEPVYLGDIVLVPLVDVVFGMGAGLGEGGGKANGADGSGGGGGGGIGAKMTPSAVVVIINGTVQLVSIHNQDKGNKLIDMLPGLLSKIDLNSLFSKKNGNDGEERKETKEEQTDTNQ